MNDYDLSSFIQPAPDTSISNALTTPAPVSLIPLDLADRVSQILDESASPDMTAADNKELIKALTAMPRYATITALIASAKSAYTQPLDCDQYIYLYLLDSGFTVSGACKSLCIARSLPTIWRRTTPLFADCLDAIILSKAQEAEQKALDIACFDDKASDERRFVIKAHNPKYRDNAPPAGEGKININITVDNREIDISDNYKVIGDETDRD